jgi:intracellular sulfur oxidation DsrE/DsrF family protein
MRTFLRVASLGFVLTFGSNAVSFAQTPAHNTMHYAAKHKVVFQVSDSDTKKWELTLNNVKNVQKDLGRDNVDIEVVAYGPGIGMLKLDSKVASGIGEMLATGVKIVACENTMHGQSLTKDDMLSNIGYVPAGVVELMKKQQEGYAYVRP